MKKRLTIIVILLFVILIGLGALKGLSYFKGLDKAFIEGDSSEIIVDVPMGSSTTDIANILESNGIIADASKFKLFSKLNKYDGNYVAGVYLLSPGMTSTEICDIISSGEVATFKYTIPEGYIVDEIIDTIVATGHADRSRLENAIFNGNYPEYEFLRDVPSEAHPLEGYLFPETYIFHYGTTEEEIVRAMLDRFQEVYNNDFVSIGNRLGYSTHEILTVASIIEKETMHLGDKDKVASVIYNRLDIGMRLQMDTSVIYAMGENKLDLTYDDIEIDSPYNTYLVDGLPIGPICCPGMDAITAALHPANTDYYYFVVSDKGDGSIKFAETYWEFEQDKEAYYASREDD